MCVACASDRSPPAMTGGAVDRRLSPILTQVWVLYWVLKVNLSE